MPEENDFGTFILGIKLIKNSEGEIKYQTRSLNEGLLTDVVIMQLRSFLKKLEKEYFSKNN